MYSQAVNLSEFYRQMSYIADDETSMQKLMKYVRRLVKTCAAAKEQEAEGYVPRTHDQLAADFKEACMEVKMSKEGKLTLPTWEELINEAPSNLKPPPTSPSGGRLMKLPLSMGFSEAGKLSPLPLRGGLGRGLRRDGERP